MRWTHRHGGKVHSEINIEHIPLREQFVPKARLVLLIKPNFFLNQLALAGAISPKTAEIDL